MKVLSDFSSTNINNLTSINKIYETLMEVGESTNLHVEVYHKPVFLNTIEYRVVTRIISDQPLELDLSIDDFDDLSILADPIGHDSADDTACNANVLTPKIHLGAETCVLSVCDELTENRLKKLAERMENGLRKDLLPQAEAVRLSCAVQASTEDPSTAYLQVEIMCALDGERRAVSRTVFFEEMFTAGTTSFKSKGRYVEDAIKGLLYSISANKKALLEKIEIKKRKTAEIDREIERLQRQKEALK